MPSRRGRTSLILLAGAAIITGTVLWAGTGNLISRSGIKDDLAVVLSNALGREVTIDGPVSISPGLHPVLTAEGISIANLPGTSRPQMLQARAVRASLDPFGLLLGEAAVTELVLVDADLRLERAPDGTPNWRFVRTPRPLHAAAAMPAAPGAAPVAAAAPRKRHALLLLQRVALQGGQIGWSGTAQTLAIHDAEITADDEQSPLRLKLTGHAGDLQFSVKALTGNLERLRGGPVTALSGTWPIDVRITAGDSVLAFVGGVAHPEAFRGYSLRMTGNARNLTALAALLPASLNLPLSDVNVTALLSDGDNEIFRTSAVSLHAGASDLSTVIAGFALQDLLLSAPGPGQQAQLTMTGRFHGTPVKLAATATQPDVLQLGAPVPLALSAEAASATIAAHGTIPPSLGGSGLDLDVSVRAPSLADLSPFALRPLPDVKDLSFNGKLADAGFRLRGIAVHGLALGSSLGDLAGDVTAAWAPVPTLTGTLKSSRFDLDGARAAWAVIANPPPSPGTQPQPAPPPPPPPPEAPGPATAAAPLPVLLIPDTPFDLSSLHAADADLTLSAGAMTVDGQTWHEVDAHLLSTDGKIVLNPARARTPDGVLIGAVTMDASAAPPTAAISLRSPSLSADGVSRLLGAPGAASGTVQLDLELSAAGVSPRAMAATLSGHAGLSMVNGGVSDTLGGALSGSPLADTLAQAGVKLPSGTTSLRCLALRAIFSHGHGQLAALALDTPELALDGTGDVDLAAETFALHLRPSVRVGGTGVSAPVSVTGSFAAPQAQLDPVLGGRVGISIGGPAPDDSKCIAALAVARGGQPGPMPAVVAAPGAGEPKRKKKPKDLLQGLFH